MILPIELMARHVALSLLFIALLVASVWPMTLIVIIAALIFPLR